MKTFDDKHGRELIHNFLHDGLCEVDFIKADGSFRTMRCTLNEEVIREYADWDEVKPKGSVNLSEQTKEDVQRVFDVENAGWRSFRFDSVKSIRTEIG